MSQKKLKRPQTRDLILKIDQEGKLVSQIYDKQDDLNFPIVNFQYLRGNIPASLHTSTRYMCRSGFDTLVPVQIQVSGFSEESISVVA